MSWIVRCPKCKREHHEQLDGVVSEYTPQFKCRFCDWTGPLMAKNPKPGGIEPTNLFEFFMEKYRDTP